MTSSLRKRLYALQQRAALTGPEAGALLVTSMILLTGFAVRHLEASREPLPSPAFALLDAEVAARAAGPVEEARAVHAPGSEAGAPFNDHEVDEHEAPPPQVLLAREGRGEGEKAGTSPPSRLGPLRVNVNTADARTLERLPGIGPALAARVVEYREQHGSFRSAEDLAAVRGIGPKTVEKLAPYVAVE